MHARMDRMKTLRWLMVLVGFIYMVERGTDKAKDLVTHSFAECTKMVKVMNAASEKDRNDAESFQQALDRHNGVRAMKWKRPQGRSLAKRADEFKSTSNPSIAKE